MMHCQQQKMQAGRAAASASLANSGHPRADDENNSAGRRLKNDAGMTLGAHPKADNNLSAYR
jgi:hypothetical protein